MSPPASPLRRWVQRTIDAINLPFRVLEYVFTHHQQFAVLMAPGLSHLQAELGIPMHLLPASLADLQILSADAPNRTTLDAHHLWPVVCQLHGMCCPYTVRQPPTLPRLVP